MGSPVATLTRARHDRHAAKAAASHRLAELSGQARVGVRTVDIRWEDFNFPLRREPCNILHIDMAELQRVDQRAYATVKLVYIWYFIFLGVLALNCTPCRYDLC